jgi:hypothetical protein
MLTEITKLVSIILAISLASDRLVTFIKTLIPWLAEKPAAAQPVQPTNDTARRVTVMIIAFAAATLTSWLLGQDKLPYNFWIMGLLASGGSAFWTNILAYLSAIKDISNQKAVQEKVKSQSQIQEFIKNR